MPPLSKRFRRLIGAGMICASALAVAIVSTPALSLPSWGTLQSANPAKAPKSLGLIMLARTAMVRVRRATSVSPPVFVSKSEINRASGSSADLSVSAPASIADSDTLYLAVWNANSGANAATCSGFSQIYHDGAAAPTLTILKKTAASESGAYAVASTTSGRALAQILVYRGGSGTEDVIGTIARATSATSTASTITALTNGVLLAFFGIQPSTAKTITTPPSGMTQRAATTAGTNYTGAAYELTPSAPGSTGTKVLVWDGSAAVGSVLMQIK